MKSKSKIKLSEKERNLVDLIRELPVTVQHAKYLAKYIKENNFKNIYTYIYKYALFIYFI